MAMARFHLPPENWQAAALTGDEARHLSQVLRGKAGDAITVFDGHGCRASAKVLQVSRDSVSLEISEIVSPTPPQPRITLAQAIPKGKTMDLIVQKAVELGVASIEPLVTRHTIVQPGESKSEKWMRVALEACKQCGQDMMPKISPAVAFDTWIAGAGKISGLKLIASLAPGAQAMREVLRAHPTTEATILVGPEGDFSPQESAAALAAGFIPVSLGNIVLRVETASLYCISALRYEFA